MPDRHVHGWRTQQDHAERRQRATLKTLLTPYPSLSRSVQDTWWFNNLMTWFIKIGCCNSTPAQRIKQWDKCYLKATIYHQEVFEFPQRIEKLIHLGLADKRYSKRCFENILQKSSSLLSFFLSPLSLLGTDGRIAGDTRVINTVGVIGSAKVWSVWLQIWTPDSRGLTYPWPSWIILMGKYLEAGDLTRITVVQTWCLVDHA